MKQNFNDLLSPKDAAAGVVFDMVQECQNIEARRIELNARVKVHQWNIQNKFLNIKYTIEGAEYEKHFFADKQLIIESLVGVAYEDYNPKYDRFISQIEVAAGDYQGITELKFLLIPFEVLCENWETLLEDSDIKRVIINHELKIIK